MDGATLKWALHQRGINLRYLGHVLKTISQSEHVERLRHIMVRLTYCLKLNNHYPDFNATFLYLSKPEVGHK